MKNYLLDTNVLVALIRNKQLEKRFHQLYPMSQDYLISIVTEGELKLLAKQWNWGLGKRETMRQTLEKYVTYPIRVQAIVDTYAQLDAYSQGKLSSKPLPPNMSARNMGKNNIWIATTALVTNLTLITTDKDFDHLNEYFIDVEYLDVAKFS